MPASPDPGGLPTLCPDHSRARPAVPQPHTAQPPTTPQVRPVTADKHDLTGMYECPVYANMQRANVYSPGVSTFTLRTAQPAHKWVLAGVALLLQDELS
jgi:hypothetical protein